MFSDHFTVFEYAVREDGGKDMVTVPERELLDLIEFADLAKAASPAQCNHPADGLEAFELIPDCCVCGECGAVLKNFSTLEAHALGIDPGWTKLDSGLLESLLRKALGPVFDLLDYVQRETGQWGDCSDAMGWADAATHTDPYRKLRGVR